MSAESDVLHFSLAVSSGAEEAEAVRLMQSAQIPDKFPDQTASALGQPRRTDGYSHRFMLH